MTEAATSRKLSDAAIARRAAGGNPQAFAALFERYHQDLYRYCAAILGSGEDAHDAVQNTMLKVLRALPGETRNMKLKPWLYRIAHNEAIDLIRARRNTEPIEVEAQAGHGGPDEEVEARDRIRRLLADIGELPTRQRGALVMREMGGLSYGQIGDALQTSPEVARQTLYEARLSLRQMSEGREMPCEETRRAISDDDGRVLRRRDIRAHLTHCESCRGFRGEIAERRRDFAAVAPLPAAASAAILHGLLGSGAASSGAGGSVAGAAGGKALVSAGAIKSAAAVCAVSAVGLLAANHSGVIHLGIGGHHDPPSSVTPARNHQATRSTSGATAPSAAREAAMARRRAEARPAIRRAKAASSANPKTTAAAVPQAAPGQAAAAHGRHLGWSKGPSGQENAGKPASPGKEQSHPTHSQTEGSHGSTAHAAPGSHRAGKPPKAHPSHPPHPSHPAQPGQSSPAKAPEATPGSSAPPEPSNNGQHGKANAE